MQEVKKLFRKSNMHDYELQDIIVDYKNATVTMKWLTNTRVAIPPKPQYICIPHIIEFSIECKKPWGGGIYVAASDVEERDGECRIEIQLNSGDRLKIAFMD